MINSQISHKTNQDSMNNPSQYRLHQNFPQSFYKITNICFDIPEKTNVKLAIYDVYGRDIFVLLEEEMHKGSYEIKWNGYALEPGIYFYKLRAGDFVDSKKMFLLKN